jgi:hypothetical protein
VLGQTKEQVFKFPVDGTTPVQLTYLRSDDVPLQWSTNESHLYVRRTSAWPPAVDLVNMTTGERVPWRVIQPADPAGVDGVYRILITPDGQAYCHDYVRFLSELFVVEGLK